MSLDIRVANNEVQGSLDSQDLGFKASLSFDANNEVHGSLVFG